MALEITDECINCGYCVAECPNQAIYEAGMMWSLSEGTSLEGTVTLYNGTEIDTEKMHAPLSHELHFIVPQKCTECKSVHNNPQCLEVCPNPSSFQRHQTDEKIIDLLLKQYQLNIETK